jgi:TonB-dependent receptor
MEEAYSNDNIGEIPNETRGNLGGQRNVAVWRHGRDIFSDAQDTQVHSFDIKQDLGDFSINLRGGYSNTTQDDTFNLRSFWRAQRQWGQDGNPEPFLGSELRGGTVCENPEGKLRCRIETSPGNPEFVNPIDGSTPLAAQTALFDFGELFEPQSFSNTRRQSDDTAKSVYLDVTWHKEFGFFTSFEAGAKWNERDKQVNNLYTSCGVTCLTDQDGISIIQDLRLQDLTSGMVPSNFIAEQGYARDGQTDGWPIIDLFAVKDLIDQGEADGKIVATLNPVELRRLQQDVLGGYIQGNFEFDDFDISGDIGLRYAETNVIGTGPSYMQFEHSQGFGLNVETLAFYGYLGEGDPNNTITLAEATALHNERFLPLVGLPAGDQADSRNGRSAGFSVNETNSYNNLLPSLNVNWIASDEVVLRFAASETIARPPFNDLFPRFNVNESVFGERSSGNIGATSLLPFKSQNLDVSAEWYFSEASLFSVAIFNKDLKDFTQRNTFDSFYRDTRATYFDLDNAVLDEVRGGIRATAFTAEEVAANGDFGPTTDLLIPFDSSGVAPGCMPNRENGIAEGLRAPEYCDVVQLTQIENGSGGYVRGIEFGLTHDFSKQLPGVWSGLGFTANYTYADSHADEQVQLAPDGVTVLGVLPEAPLVNTSEHTYNGTIYWEKGGNLLRLAYSGRSDYLINRIQRDMSRWSEGFESLDFSAAYKLNNNVRFTFQAINLLDTVTRQYETNRVDRTAGQETLLAESSVLGEQYNGRTVQTWNTGTTYRLSVRATF